MTGIKLDLKQELRECGRTIADLSRSTMIEYRRLSGYMNGYFSIRPDEETEIYRQIEDWKIGKK